MGSDLFAISKSGLFASKKALQTTGHNIANVNTEGYSRQRVEQQNAPPLGEGGLVFGSGTKIQSINRIHDQHIEKRMRDVTSNKDYHQNKFEKLSQVENIFNEVDGEGLNQLLTRFFNSFRDLSNQPENETIRSIVRENAKLVTKDFHRIKNDLRGMSNQIDHTVKTSVEEINQKLFMVADLNKKIANIEGVHGASGDLRDQRDLAVKDLSKYFKLHTYSDEKNQFIVHVKGVGSMVAGASVQTLRAASVPKEMSTASRDGTIEISLTNRPSFIITNSIKEGSFKGMFETRNTNIKKLMDRVDELAFNLAKSVNAIHRKGHINNQPISSDGRGLASSSISGINFFEEPNEIDKAADNLNISKEVSSDLRNLATALAPNAPGDNRIAIAISKLQHERILEEGTQTLEEHFLESIGNIGVATAKAKLDYEQSEGIMTQIQSIKERISGVSIDEEAANMIKYQQAYDASAKVLSTADQMFKSVLNIVP